MTAWDAPAAGTSALEATCARLLPPGANRPGRATDAPWVVLLPQPGVGGAWIAGQPTAREIAGVARVADGVRLVDAASRPADLDERLRRLDVDPARVATGPPADGATPGLLWLRRDARGGATGTGALADRVRAAGGVVFAERQPDDDPGWQRLRAGPILGSVRMAHPAGDPDSAALARRARLEESWARRWLASHGIPRPRPLLRRVVAAERALAARRPRSVALGGRGVDGRRPPAWLCAIAAAQGLDIADHAWAFAAPGDYPTQKVLLALEPRGASGGGAILAKVAVDPVGVPRLAAATAMLRRLGTLEAAVGRVPRVSFAGQAAGLGVLAETIATGHPFERLDPAGARSAAVDVVGWLSDLAVATSVPADLVALRAGLDRILAAYATAYAPGEAELTAIRARLAIVTGAGQPIRTVFLHGDPGVQNLLVDGGRVTMLDWENGDPAGLPVWDVAIFLRSYAVWATAGRGRGSRFAAVRRHLVDGSSLTPELATALEAYRRRVGIAPALVEPLVTLGWVWLAARDAARLDPGRAADGQAIRVARLFLEHGARCAVFGGLESTA